MTEAAGLWRLVAGGDAEIDGGPLVAPPVNLASLSSAPARLASWAWMALSG